jgi:hypothetical protein
MDGWVEEWRILGSGPGYRRVSAIGLMGQQTADTQGLQGYIVASSCVVAVLLLKIVRVTITVFCGVALLTVIAIYCLHLHGRKVRHAQQSGEEFLPKSW